MQQHVFSRMRDESFLLTEYINKMQFFKSLWVTLKLMKISQ